MNVVPTGTPSIRSASGMWFATPLFVLFCFAQGLQFDRKMLTAMCVWVPVGVVIDVWTRRLRPLEAASERRLRNRRTINWMAAVSVAWIIVWSLFRPDRTIASTGTWVASTNDVIRALGVVLPGLEHANGALLAAGRADVAAYFGAYQVATVLLFVASVFVWARLLSVSSVDAAEPKATKFAARAREEPAWFIAYWGTALFMILCAVGFLIFFWHQDVVAADRFKSEFWENAITGLGAFVWPTFAMGMMVGHFGWFFVLARALYRAIGVRTDEQSVVSKNGEER